MIHLYEDTKRKDITFKHLNTLNIMSEIAQV